MLTVIIDYDSGNLHSAEKAFQRMAAQLNAGATPNEVIVSSRPEDVARADRIVLPGDGAFPACRKQLLDQRAMSQALCEAVIDNARPFMGICVGMQMLATMGHEYFDTDGLNWINGHVRKIQPHDRTLKVPHMGWNDLIIDQPHPVLNGIKNGAHAYFVHSYHFVVDDTSERLAHCDYGGDITAIVGRDNMIGMQFHPEKSQAAGLQMIENFLTWAP